MSKRMAGIVALSGIALGVVIGWLVRPGSSEPIGDASHATERRVEPDGAAASRSDPGSAAPKVRPLDAVRSEDSPAAKSESFDAELARRGRDGIRSGWSQVRRDEIPATLLDPAVANFTDEVAQRPEAIGRSLAEKRTKQEQATALGPAFLALERMKQGEAVPPGLVTDPAQFNALFERQRSEVPVDGVKARDDLKKALTDGATLQFPAGVFRVDLASALQSIDSRTHTLPADFTVAGAGIDDTLLVTGAIGMYSAVHNWTFRDCTIFSAAPLVQLNKDASLTIDRVRLIGFDIGAGMSNAFFLMANVLRCRDSIIEGGYGSHPEDAELLDVRSEAMLARFERCRLTGLRIDWISDSWRIAFDECRFTDYLVRSDEHDPRFSKGMTTTNCSFTFLDESKSKPPQKNLDLLFPNWETFVRR